MKVVQTFRLFIVVLCLLILQAFALPSQALAQLITFDRVANVTQSGGGSAYQGAFDGAGVSGAAPSAGGSEMGSGETGATGGGQAEAANGTASFP